MSSRYVMTEPLKSKRASEVVKVLDKVFRHRTCINSRSDAGCEFNNKVSKLLASKSIKHIIARNPKTKANYVERVIRTLTLFSRLRRSFKVILNGFHLIS